MSFHVVPLMPKATAGKSRITRQRTDFGERSRARKVGGEWQIVAAVQLEALKAIAVFSAQPHDASPSREYLLSMLERHRTKQNEAKRNETVNAVFLESCVLLPFHYCSTDTYRPQLYSRMSQCYRYTVRVKKKLPIPFTVSPFSVPFSASFRFTVLPFRSPFYRLPFRFAVLPFYRSKHRLSRER